MARYVNILRGVFLGLALAAAAGCAPAVAPEESGGVQDINPGDKSMISAPASPAASQPSVQERNI